MDQGGKCLYNGAMEHSGNVVLGTRKWAGVFPRIQVHLVFKIWLWMIVFSNYFTQLNHRAVESFIKTSPDQWGTTPNIRCFCWMMLEAFLKKWYWFALSQECGNSSKSDAFMLVYHHFCKLFTGCVHVCSFSQFFACGYQSFSSFFRGFSHEPCPKLSGLGHQAALKLAQCILQARHSPLLDAQLRLLKEPPGAQSCAQRTELKEQMGSWGKGKNVEGSPPGCSELNNFGLKNGVYWVYCFCFFWLGTCLMAILYLLNPRQECVLLVNNTLGC